MRPSRILAVARRDLAAELRGTHGWVLPAVMAALLVPSSAVPPPAESIDIRGQTTWVIGAVPPEVEALPNVRRRRRGALYFHEVDGTLIVTGPEIPDPIREVLDGPDPDVAVEILPVGFVFPGRTLLFALISASTLTGAVSTSIGGERSRRTLVVLLAAAISRLEIVCGKALAWGGLGAASAVVAATLAIALGNVEGGLWLVPLPTVPIATVAFGLWLVRRASDVIAGSTVSLRVLPALLAASGIVAWFLGDAVPVLGALVPVGGALIASGDTWPDPVAVVLSGVVTLAFSAACLWSTAQDLEEVPSREPRQRLGWLTLTIGALAAITWWIPTLIPLLWSEAGNPVLTAELLAATGPGSVAGALGLLAFSVVRAARGTRLLDDLGLQHPLSPRTLGAGLLGGLLLVGIAPLIGLLPLPAGDLALACNDRLQLALQPVGGGLPILLITIVADELLFRGWLPRLLGPVRSGLLFTAIKAPLDPLGGLLLASSLGALGQRAGVAATILARLAWAGGALVLPSLPTAAAVAIAAIAATAATVAWRAQGPDARG